MAALTKYYMAGGSTIHSGPTATVEELTREARTYEAIYLATHGRASDEQALDHTFIALAGKPLTVFEVFRQNLKRDLTRRSASPVRGDHDLAANMPPALKDSHHRFGIPANLLGVLPVSLPRGLKLDLEVNYFLRQSGVDAVTPVAVHHALAEAIISRNLSW